MIEGQVLGGAAILALEAIAQKHVEPRKGRIARGLDVGLEGNNGRQPHFETGRMHLAIVFLQNINALEKHRLDRVLPRPKRQGEITQRTGYRVQDLVARLGDNSHPPVVGAVIRIEGRDLFVPIRKIGGLSEGRMTFEGKRVDLRRFERRPGELLLAEDLLARHLINLVRGRLITANEIEIAQIDNKWEVVGIDPGKRPFLRRILGKSVGRRVKSEAIVDFASIEPFVSHVPTARLRIPYRKLSKLHPAQIADLVEQASHEEGEEIIEAVGADRELEADVFEELDTTHQLEFLEARSDVDAARLLARMEPDNAADLISEIDQDRGIPILERLPDVQKSKVRQLLSYSGDLPPAVS